MKAKYNFYPYLFMLLLYGLLAVFSSSAVFSYVKTSSQYSMFIKQLLVFIIGGVLFYLARFLVKKFNPNGILTLLAWGFGILSVIALLYVAINGAIYNNAARWIKVGPVIFQPSELFKLASIIILAVLFNNKGIIPLKKINIISISVILIGLFLILFEPDFSTMALIGLVLISIIFISNIPFRTTFFIVFMALIIGTIFIVSSGYRLQRIKSHFSNNKNLEYSSKYQNIQSKKAIKDGGIFGRGLGKSKRKIFYLPQAWSDYILAIILEESGILGFGLLIFLYSMILLKIFHIAWHLKNINLKLFVYGVFILFIYEILLNIAVTIDLIPATGLPLPLVSAGGSNSLVFLLMLGIVAGLGERL